MKAYDAIVRGVSRLLTVSGLGWAVAFIVTFAIVCATFGPVRRANYAHGWNDFLAFYAGGKLAFTDSLYDPGAIAAEQLRTADIAPPVLRFIRLPHYAMLLSPLTLLPYIPAFALWQIVNVAGIAAAIWLWPYPRRVFTCLLLACPPVYWGLSLGQDTGLLLCGVSALVRYIRNPKDAGIGLALACCLIKFHLIWLAPVALFRRRRALIVFAALGSTLLCVPLLFNPHWPAHYYQTVVNSRSVISHTPQNLFPLLGWYGLPLALVSIVLLSRRVSVEMAFMLSLVTAVLVAPHAYVYDYALVAPLLAVAATGGARRTSLTGGHERRVREIVGQQTGHFDERNDPSCLRRLKASGNR